MRAWRGTIRRLAGAAVLMLAPLSPLGAGQAAAPSGESVGMITEMKLGDGRVEVKTPTRPEWRAAGPLLALRSGDTVRASGSASAVVLLSGGRGVLKVDAATSPVVMATAAPATGKLEKARALVDGSLGFLAQSAKEAPTAGLFVRSGPRPPVILSPRGGTVLPGPLAFEWLGSQFARYTVRVSGPTGVLIERKGIVGARFDYPSEAPALRPGARYTLRVEGVGQASQETQFEVLDAARTERLRDALAELQQTLSPSVSPNTLTTLRAALLAREGLFHDARTVLVTALARDPDEPTLHALLGRIYLLAGLVEQAAEAFDEAQFLISHGTE